jgi:hypothetical protein
MADQIAVRVVRAFDEVEGLRPVWTAWQRIADADIDYYLLTLQSSPTCLRPHIIVLYRDGLPQTLLIGKLENCGIWLKVGQWRLPSPRARGLAFIYGGLLGDQSPRNCEILMRSILDSLSQGEADFALFNKLKTDSSLHGIALRAPAFLCRDHFAGSFLHCSMKLPSDTDALYRGLSSDHRNQIRRKARHLLAAYPDRTRIASFQEVEEMEDALADVERVAQKTYQRGLGVGFKNDPAFHQSLALTASKGWLRGYILYLDDTPVAFWIGTLFGGVFRLDYLGYDPAYERFSPGIFLITKVLEDLCQNAVREIDFGYGVERYKQQFGNCTWHEAIIHIFAPTFKGLALNAVRTLVLVTDRLARTILERTKLLPKLKRAWRIRIRPAQARPS